MGGQKTDMTVDNIMEGEKIDRTVDNIMEGEKIYCKIPIFLLNFHLKDENIILVSRRNNKRTMMVLYRSPEY